MGRANLKQIRRPQSRRTTSAFLIALALVFSTLYAQGQGCGQECGVTKNVCTTKSEDQVCETTPCQAAIGGCTDESCPDCELQDYQCVCPGSQGEVSVFDCDDSQSCAECKVDPHSLERKDLWKELEKDNGYSASLNSEYTEGNSRTTKLPHVSSVSGQAPTNAADTSLHPSRETDGRLLKTATAPQEGPSLGAVRPGTTPAEPASPDAVNSPSDNKPGGNASTNSARLEEK